MQNVNKTINMLIIKKLRKRSAKKIYDSESSSEEEILVKMANRIEQKRHGKAKNFVNDIVLNYSLSDFSKHFRISKAKFEELYLSVEQKAEHIECGRPPYPVLDSLLLTIWSLATQESFRQIGSRFNVSEGHAYRIMMKYCKYITRLKDRYIVWPSGQQTEKHMQDFNKLRGEQSFPNVFGCLDGTHIPIPGPTGDNSYYNRKGFHSLQLQGICDAKTRFINVNCGWPGSVHDARVWQSCEIYKKLRENTLNVLPAGTYLLADSAYPLAKYLITPFKDNGNLSRQRRFNAKLSSTRVIIEQAFGRLKGMFRRLKYLHVLKLTNVKYILIAACVLHNLCIEDDTVECELYDEETGFEFDFEGEENAIENQEAVEFRNLVMNSIIS